MNKFMRILVFFDLPVGTKKERQQATKFRNFLLKDGFYMLQFSVYARICNGVDSVETHERRIANNNPDNGSVRILTVTEKQYENMKIILGNTSADIRPVQLEMPLLF
jgi:CRISPR-associated protein Cas2